MSCFVVASACSMFFISEVEYLLATFVDMKIELHAAQKSWLHQHIDSVAHMDSAIPSKESWLQVWEFLLGSVELTACDDVKAGRVCAKEMGRRVDLAIIMANPPRAELKTQVPEPQSSHSKRAVVAADSLVAAPAPEPPSPAPAPEA